MKNVGLLDSIPLSLLFPLACLLLFVCYELGFRAGRGFSKGKEDGHGSSASVSVGAVLGFLAFMLAFTFNSAATTFRERRDVVIEDSNAIGTTYLRTYMIPEPEGSEMRVLLREYVDDRLHLTSFKDIDTKKAEESQTHMWKLARSASQKDQSPIMATFVQSLNKMIDVNTERVSVVLNHRVVDAIWLSLFVLMVLAIASMGYQGGLQTTLRSPTSIVLAIAFTIVLFGTAALDRPGAAMFLVDQSAMEDLRVYMDHEQ